MRRFYANMANESTLTLAMIPHLLLFFNIPWENWRHSQGYGLFNYASVTKSHFELVCSHPKNSNVDWFRVNMFHYIAIFTGILTEPSDGY